MSSSADVTIGVPVYRGELFLEEALRSIQEQTYRNFEVIISLDGPDPGAEKICAPFLEDGRFRLVIQPERLGWVGNINWLMAQVATPFWYYHQQDDLTEPTYVEVLLEHARQWPDAAVVYCDLVAFGTIEFKYAQPSVVGSPSARQLVLLYEHHPAVAFRGLTRTEALRLSGGIPTNSVENFSVETTWMAAVARWGELRRVPVELYRKRYHAENTHMKWKQWPPERRALAWAVHCADMLHQAMLTETTVQERRLLWLAAIGRLSSPRTASGYLPVEMIASPGRDGMLDLFLTQIRATGAMDIPSLLEAGWQEITRWSKEWYRHTPRVDGVVVGKAAVDPAVPSPVPE